MGQGDESRDNRAGHLVIAGRGDSSQVRMVPGMAPLPPPVYDSTASSICMDLLDYLTLSVWGRWCLGLQCMVENVAVERKILHNDRLELDDLDFYDQRYMADNASPEVGDLSERGYARCPPPP